MKSNLRDPKSQSDEPHLQSGMVDLAGFVGVAQTASESTCSICGASSNLFEDYHGRRRRCTVCGSIDRQRVFADLYRTGLKERYDLTGARVLVIAPMASELRLLKDLGASEIVTADVRPEAKTDLTIDVCNMPKVPDGSFDVIFASYVLTCVHDLDKALLEFTRVLRPAGVLLTCDPIESGRATEEYSDLERIRHWYGKDAHEKFKVGHFRRLGDLDAARLIGRHFADVEAVVGTDVQSGATVVWHIAGKQAGNLSGPEADAWQTSADVSMNRLLGKSLPFSIAMKFSVANCTVCGATLAPGFQASKENEICPKCRSVARARTLRPIVVNVVEPLLPMDLRLSRPLLSFAMDENERILLNPAFRTYRSVSLYGTYNGPDHEEGVDVRELSRFKRDEFCGIFGITLFDFFTEHDKALRDCFRVIAPGGMLFTLIAPYRLLDGSVRPSQTDVLVPRLGYLDYMPAGTTLPHVEVGRDWFVKAMRRAGFDADRVSVRDEATGQDFDWFIGIKPKAAPACSATAELGWSLAAPAVATSTITPLMTKSYSTPLDPATGFKRVSVTLTAPSVPVVAADCKFAINAFSSAGLAPTKNVYAVQKGGVLVSTDLGKHWDYVPTRKTGGARLHHAFRVSDGSILLQSSSPHRPDDTRTDPELAASVFVCDNDLNVLDQVQPGKSNWHGTRSIDEANGTIIYSEYPENSIKYRSDFAERRSELSHLLEDCSVFRSVDGGRSWTKTLEVSWEEIRHFHTAVADPHEPKVWYVSSGDMPEECRVWRSQDDGISWVDVTGETQQLDLHPTMFGRHGSIHRHTDMIVLPDRLIWGTDDLLGRSSDYRDPKATMSNRVGSRIFMSPKTSPLQPQCIGFAGSHVRSIVDVGPGYLFITEAKRTDAVSRPQVHLLTKSEPYVTTELFTLDRYLPTGTGFTYSRNSRAALDGRFFTYRDKNDVFAGGVPILQWDIAFE